MDQSTSYIEHLEPSFILVLYIAGAAITVLLFAFPRTRAVGLSLLGCGALLALLLYWRSSSPHSVPVRYSPQRASPPIHVEPPLEAAISTGEKPPSWVDAPPRAAGEVYRMSVASGPYTTRAECEAHLPAALHEALDRYVEASLGVDARGQVTLPDDYLRSLVKEQWEEVRQHSVGPMVTLHALVEFDREARDRVLDAHRRSSVAGRLWLAGAIWGGWLALLGTLYGVLKNTRGGGDRPPEKPRAVY